MTGGSLSSRWMTRGGSRDRAGRRREYGLVTGYAQVRAGERMMWVRSGDREWLLTTRVPRGPVTLLLTDGPRGPVLHTCPTPRRRLPGSTDRARAERHEGAVPPSGPDDRGRAGRRAGAACASDQAGDVATPDDPVAAATATGQSFLPSYVDPDGRVVRRDEGGDTVSEGQAYALLIAVALGDRPRFDAVWTWTREHLQRPDRLLSWRWADGAVVDPNSASDADSTPPAPWSSPGTLRRPRADDAGRELAAAVLARETVPVGTTLLPPGTAAPTPGTAIEGSGLLLTAVPGRPPRRLRSTPATSARGRTSSGCRGGKPTLGGNAPHPAGLELATHRHRATSPGLGRIDMAGTATPQPDPPEERRASASTRHGCPPGWLNHATPRTAPWPPSCCPGSTDPTLTSSRATRSTAGRSSTGRTRLCSWIAGAAEAAGEEQRSETDCARRPNSTRGRRPTTDRRGSRSATSCWTPSCSAGVPDRHGGRPRSLPSAAARAGRSRQVLHLAPDQRLGCLSSTGAAFPTRSAIMPRVGGPRRLSTSFSATAARGTTSSPRA